MLGLLGGKSLAGRASGWLAVKTTWQIWRKTLDDREIVDLDSSWG
jgi:hypothetical protein